MDGLNPILVGLTVALAAGAVGVMAVLSSKSRAAFVYAQLAVMVGVYQGFALVALDAADFVRRAELSSVIIESGLALAFVFAGLAALSGPRAWMLGALILMHGGVDLAHLLFDVDLAPDWYAFACIVYDAIVGVAAIRLLSNKPGDG